MQNVVAIGCFVVLLLVGIPFAFKYPWRVAMLACFVLGHVAAMVGYAALVDWLQKSPRPAARRLAAAHAALAGLLSGDPPYDGPERRLARGFAQAAGFLIAGAFYMALLLWMGGVLDWLEDSSDK